MKFLLTGSNGLLGSEISVVGPESGFHIDTISHSDIAKLVSTDICHYDAIIHCAAMTNVEKCEECPSVAIYSNILLSTKLLELAKTSDVPFVYISSVGIYADHEIPKDEFGLVSPRTIHHWSKFKVEELIDLFEVKSLIIRTGWLFSDAVGNEKNFLTKILKHAQNSKTIEANEDQIGHPTSAKFVARMIIKMLADGQLGTFNVVQEPSRSRAEYVKEILLCAEQDVSVFGVAASHFQRKAKVNLFEIANIDKLKKLYPSEIYTYHDELDICVKAINGTLT